MSVNIPTNPFLKVYDAVWDLLFNNDDGSNLLAEMVRVGNRINFGSALENDRDPWKQTVDTADVPELILMDEGGTFNLHGNSSSTAYTQFITLYVSSGDYNYGRYISAINWYIMCNLGKWKTLISSLSWRGRTGFVKNVKIIPVQVGESNPERQTMIAGFTAIWRMQWDCMIPTIDLVQSEDS
jgi:hypothetical protein